MAEPEQQRREITQEDITLVKEDIDKLNPTKTAQELTTIVISLQQLVYGLRTVSRDDSTRAEKVDAAARKISQIIAYLNGHTAKILRVYDELSRRSQQQTTATEAELRQIKETIKKLIDDFRKEVDNVKALKSLQQLDEKIVKDINARFNGFKVQIGLAVKVKVKQEFNDVKNKLLKQVDDVQDDVKKLSTALLKERRQERLELNAESDILTLKNELDKELSNLLQMINKPGEPAHPLSTSISNALINLRNLQAHHNDVIRVKIESERKLFEHIQQLSLSLDELKRNVESIANYDRLTSFYTTLFNQEGDTTSIKVITSNIIKDIANIITLLREEDTRMNEALDLLNTILTECSNLEKKLKE